MIENTPFQSPESICNLDAERSVLGACMLQASILDLVACRLHATDFFAPEHQQLFTALKDTRDAGSPFDPVVVADRLTKLGWNSGQPAEAFIQELGEMFCTGDNIDHCVALVLEQSVHRQLIALAHQIVERAAGQPVDLLIHQIRTSVDSLSDRIEVGRDESIDKDIQRILSSVEIRGQERRRTMGMRTGLLRLDRDLGGLHDGTVTTVAAFPGVGKTAFVWGIAATAALDDGVPVLVFSLGVRRSDALERLLISQSGVPAYDVGQGTMEYRQWKERFYPTGAKVVGAPLLIDDTVPTSLSTMAAKIQFFLRDPRYINKIEATAGVDPGPPPNRRLIIVDDFHMIEGTEPLEVVRFLRKLARKHSLVIVATWPLPSDDASASMATDSGWDRDADLSISVHRSRHSAAYRNQFQTAHLVIRKHNRGPTFRAKLLFNREQLRFENWIDDEALDDEEFDDLE